MESLGKMQGQRGVDVGVIGSDASAMHNDADLTMAAIAEIHEFGLGQQLRRSWLRDWITENESEIERRLRALNTKVLKGRLTVDVALARFGLWAQGSIQLRIAAGIEPENAQSTIDAKGSSTPLIDSGQFRSSITSQVRDA